MSQPKTNDRLFAVVKKDRRVVKYKIGFPEALQLVLENMPPGRTERIGLSGLTGRILADDVVAQVDSPSVDASLKDGYAVHSSDVASAAEDRPAVLTLVGFQAAGESPGAELSAGTAVRVTTGAPLPPGADAVLAGEFAREDGGRVFCVRDAGPGRNVLRFDTGPVVELGRAGDIYDLYEGPSRWPADVAASGFPGSDEYAVWTVDSGAHVALRFSFQYDGIKIVVRNVYHSR